MLTFDTATLEKRERADAMVSAMADTSFSTQLTHENPDGDLYLQMNQCSPPTSWSSSPVEPRGSQTEG